MNLLLSTEKQQCVGCQLHMHDLCFILLHSKRVTLINSLLSVTYIRRQYAGLETEPWSSSRNTLRVKVFVISNLYLCTFQYSD